MKHQQIYPILLAILTSLTVVTPGFAVVSIDYVSVGNAGNATDPSTGYGSVGYTYNIGKYEVTNAQYVEFLNSVDPTGANPNGVYNANMGIDARGGISFSSGAINGSKYTARTNMSDKPVNFVSWYDAARFSNWLGNGQGASDTESGAYTLSENIGIITKNVGATVWVPSENEWYKAAYFNQANSSYSLYPTQSNTTPTVASADSFGKISNPGINVANYFSGADWNSQNGNVTTVGSAGSDSMSYYGTFDQGGNVWEWNDTIIGSTKGIRGGSFLDINSMRSLDRGSSILYNEGFDVGFRVAAVPEPTAMFLTFLTSGVLLIRRRR